MPSDTTGLPIVQIRTEHGPSFHACLDAVCREKRYLAQLQALPLERVQGFVNDSVASDAAQFVVLDGERVVGWADIFPGWTHGLSHCGRLGMGLLPDYRGQGLGERLLRTCIAKAWAKGLTRIELEARADNARAIRLYERVGFVHEAVRVRGLRIEGVYFDAVQMRLLKPED